jgi:hypothetical protein
MDQTTIDEGAIRAMVRAGTRCGTGKGATIGIRRLIALVAFELFRALPIAAQNLAVATGNTGSTKVGS